MVVVLDGVWAARENPLEAHLVARLVTGLRGTLRGADGKLYAGDEEFFRSGVFLVSPHRAQIRLIDRELRRQRMWQRPPFVDTVDKMQGQEADAVIVSYGVSDPEFAVQEAEFIYGLNRLNVAVTRARANAWSSCRGRCWTRRRWCWTAPRPFAGWPSCATWWLRSPGAGKPIRSNWTKGPRRGASRGRVLSVPAGGARHRF